MERNIVLTLTNVLTKVMELLAWILVFAMIAMAVVWWIAPERLAATGVEEGWLRIQYRNGDIASNSIAKLSVLVFMFNIVKILVELGLLILVLRVSRRVVRSIKNRQVFYAENIKAFRHLGQLFLSWWFVSWFILREADKGYSIGINIALPLLVCSLVAFVLAEVFREGNRLYEEQQLTI